MDIRKSIFHCMKTDFLSSYKQRAIAECNAVWESK
jgi:hypothetical protein